MQSSLCVLVLCAWQLTDQFICIGFSCTYALLVIPGAAVNAAYAVMTSEQRHIEQLEVAIKC